jgi:hypothetical protein
VIQSHVKVLKTSLSDLCEPLYGVTKRSRTRAESYRLSSGFEHQRFNWLGGHLMRAHAYSLLCKDEEEGKLGGWRVARKIHKQNGRVQLYRDWVTLRLLSGSIGDPPTGRNPVRRAFYCNTPIDAPFHQEVIDGRIEARLVGSITFDLDGNPLIRVFRPLRPVGFKQNAVTDFDWDLPTTRIEADEMEFRPIDDFLPIDLPDEIEGGEEGDGTIRG